ncbi:hypothetical protein [Vibrio algicola]|uniref:Lipoprotein n=1 Tax=Vibrio algicola TaxID=2662262 RepID=A0A5Q0THS4_9VIBR|nr:hypothetical protein [Vibrio algicola]
MKAALILCAALTLSACSSVTITDGEQDAIIGSDRTQDGCHVKVSDDFKGNVTYHSKRCDVTISKPI